LGPQILGANTQTSLVLFYCRPIHVM